MRIGSLFSGGAGLDRAVEAVFGGEVVWFSEIDKAASKVLAHRFPGVPNLGSITEIDWAAVEPVDVLCGGFPCQDVSAAGKRAGIKDGTRSGLWAVFAEAIDALRPRHVIIENVRGLLNANANRPLESAEDDLGDGSDRPVLRAIGAVLGDICDIRGYEARWVTVAASSIGAPHRRERVFILASLAGSAPVGQHPGGASGAEAGANPGDRSGDHRGERTDAGLSYCGVCGAVMPSSHGLICLGCGSEPPLFHTPAARDNSGLPPHPAYTSLVTDVYGLAGRELTGIHAPAEEPETDGLWPTVRNAIGAEFGRQYGRADEQPFLADELDLDGVAHAVVAEVMPLFQTPQARDGKGTPSAGFNEGNLHSQIAELLPTPQAADGNGGKTSHQDVRRAAGHSINLSEVAINTLLTTPGLSDVKTPRRGEELQKCLEGGAKQAGSKIHTLNLADAIEDQHGRDAPPSPEELAWGKYEPAIRRWESLTRPAPAPTEPNKNNNPRLSASFSEWLMGWPQGWVTDPQIGISRGDQLRILGNGVVVQQAIAALRYLLAVNHG